MKIGLNGGHSNHPDYRRGFKQVGSLDECHEGINNFRVYEILKKKLEEYEGVEVVTARPKISDDPSLSQRAQIKADLLLQIHSNAGGGHGPECILKMDATPKEISLGKRIREKIRAFSGMPWRALRFSKLIYKNGSYDISYETKSDQSASTYHTELAKSMATTTIIVEMAFHDDDHEAELLRTKREDFAEAIATAVAEEYNLKKKQPAVQEAMQTSPEGKLFQVNLGAFKNFQYMAELINQAKKAGFSPYMTIIDDPNFKK